ncbi:hypothetical protein JJB09_24630 [Rhizobium sp. KVB221]|uniref:Tat pathway signal protein n=1 Tax=Rhizobium setariae TaxID=2801340 RepID=A0A936YUA0_9HYPH|nr:hypothetical protein [Rhizobium setariae]MBL0375206.1 hypothetical protein [Rhizobium setariae]
MSRRGFLVGTAATSVAIAAPAVASDIAELVPLDQQFDACVAQIRAVLATMHPDADKVSFAYRTWDNGRAFSVWMDGYAPPRVEYDGPGYYEVSETDNNVAGVFYIERFFSEMDQRYYLRGNYIWDGRRIAPAVLIGARSIVRKIDAAEAGMKVSEFVALLAGMNVDQKRDVIRRFEELD